MPTPKTLAERQRELQALLATPEGRARLRELVEGYAAAGGRLAPSSGSLVTYVIVHERQRGLIAG